MKLRSKVFVAAWLLTCLTPAAVSALQGVQPGNHHFTDCKNEGRLTVSLLDLGATDPPNSFDDDDEFVNPDDPDEVHGLWGYFGHLKAETSGFNTAGATVFQGCAFGNGPDPDPGEPNRQVRVPFASEEDDAVVQAELACVDCEVGQVSVVLIQRVRHWLRMAYGQEGSSGGLVPRWNVAIESGLIDGEVATTTFECELDDELRSLISASASRTSEQNPNGSMVVIEVDDDIAPGGWLEYPGWSNELDTSSEQRDIRVRSLHEAFGSAQLACDLPILKNFDYSAEFRWELSMQDYSMEQYDPNVFGDATVYQEYISVIAVWSITVTKNCDGTGDNCPCPKYQRDEAPNPS